MADPNTARANALAEINQMQTELIDANRQISDLTAQLARSQDAMALVLEERRTYREASFLFRARLVELATSMSNIGLLTLKAQEIMQTIGPLISTETPEQAAAERESARQVVNNLPANLYDHISTTIS